MAEHVVIVGAGHAGGTAAALLRQYGFEGPITLIGEEPYPPYQRPPLSKAWLKGEAGEEDLELKGHDFYAGANIDLRLNVRVEAVDRTRKTVTAGGEEIAYDTLILAVGARARTLPIEGHHLSGVFYLRTADDAEALKHALTTGKRLVVIGGGYIGLEAAASGRALGCEVTVLEREDHLLPRVASQPLSRFFHAYHRAKGVRFELGASAVAIEGQGACERVRLADGRAIDGDCVLIGVGAVPNVELAQAAGLDCRDGVVVDAEARTSDPAIFAIGDVTRRPMPLYDREWRLESVPNALEQAKQAASAIAGRPPPPPEVPWFWSDQYDIKLQIAGVPFESDEVLLRGDPAAAPFAVFHLKGDRLLAVEAANAPAEFMGGRLLILSGKPVDKAKLVDPSVSMKAVALA
ncbi:MAG TPA: FAD-dependent oxidoreductase [Caulobacteraceae bacterium]|nr:FAD-dependent oxidoreductase [Caulobacteraceae bacterium]